MLGSSHSGRVFSVHPLDLTLVMDAEDLNGEPRTVCAGVFTGKSSAPDIRDEPLWVLGDAFMRNVLTAYVHPPSSSPH